MGNAGSVNITEATCPASPAALAALGEPDSLTDGNGEAKRKEEKAMDKPKNPYQKGTLVWSVMEGDWEDLRVVQIAEVLDTTPNNIGAYISKIRKETGYSVPHFVGRPGRKLDE